MRSSGKINRKSVIKEGYFDSKPVRLSESVFNLYQYIVVDLEKSSGIVLEDCCPEFVFLKQDDVQLKIHGQAPIKLPPAFSFGKITNPYRLHSTKTIEYFAIKLQPWMARQCFPEDIHNDVIDLTSRWEKDVESFRLNLFASSSFEEMVDNAERFFADLEIPDPESYNLVMAICKRIYASKGVISVRDLVREFSESRQRINREFLFHTKFSLKAFAIFVKIREAVKFRQENPTTTFADLAYQFGYFDQSHFIWDIKRVSSITPRLLFAQTNFVKEQLKEL